MSHIEALAVYLESIGVGTFDPLGVGGNIYIDLQPAEPDSIITLRSTGGMNDEYAPFWGLDSSFPSVQIIVRSDRMNLLEAKTKAEQIHKAVRRLSLPYDGGRVFDSVTQPPALLGTDQNGRAEYSLNVQLEVTN